MNRKNELIYKLIFSKSDSHEINISDYIDHSVIYKYDRFIKEIKRILEDSKVRIQKETLNINSIEQIIWKINTVKLANNVEI